MTNEATIQNLIENLQDTNPWIRSHAAEELGHIGASSAVPSLINALRDEDTEVRSNAARALGDTGRSEAIAALTTGLEDAHSTVRVWVTYALGKLGAVHPLIEALKDSDWCVRAHALNALGALGTSAQIAIPALKIALNDPNQHVRNNARKALEELKNHEN